MPSGEVGISLRRPIASRPAGRDCRQRGGARGSERRKASAS